MQWISLTSLSFLTVNFLYKIFISDTSSYFTLEPINLNYSYLEMAERHDSKVMLRMARDLVLQLQMLIEDK